MLDNLLGQIVEFFLRQFRELFTSGAESGLEMAITMLNTTPVPDLNASIFQSLYLRVWGFAVMASLVTGLIGVLFASVSRRRRGTAGQSIFHFARVYIIGLLLPLAVALGLMVSDLFVQGTMSAAPTPLSTDTLLSPPGAIGVGLELIATAIAFVNWVLGWVLAFWIMFLTWAILPLLVMAVAMSPLALVNKDPARFMRRSYLWLSVAIFGKMLVTLVLVIGISILPTVQEFGLEMATQGYQALIFVGAIWLSFGLRKRFDDSGMVDSWMPTPLNLRLTAEQSISTARLESLRTGLSSGREWYSGHSQEQHRLHQAVVAGTEAVALSSPDPRVKTVAAAGKWIAQRSLERKQRKEQASVN